MAHSITRLMAKWKVANPAVDAVAGPKKLSHDELITIVEQG
jgi:hypothetical protein